MENFNKIVCGITENDDEIIEIGRYPITIRGKLKEAIELYAKLNLPRKLLLSDYLAVVDKLGILGKAENPWMYLNKGIDGRNIESGVSVQESAFNFAAMELKDYKPTEVINASFYRDRNDAGFEIDYCLRQLNSVCKTNDTTMIVNPSPKMILSWESEHSQGKNYYVVQDITVKHLYEFQFKESIFYTLDDIVEIAIDNILLINRDVKASETSKLMRWANLAKDNILAELPNTYVEDRIDGLADFLKSSFWAVENMILLDSNATNTTPRKKTFVVLTNKEQYPKFSLRILDSDKKCMIIHGKSYQISAADFWRDTITLIQLKNYCIAEKWKITKNQERKYSESEQYFFSEEIALWYKVYHDGKKYVGQCWYRKIKDPEKGLYGKRITAVVNKGLRADSEDEVINKLGDLIIDDRIYPFVIKDIEEVYLSHGIELSLKTLWVYLYQELKSEKNYDQNIFDILFFNGNDIFSSYKLNSEQDISKVLAIQLGFNEEDIPLKYLQQLDLFFQIAVRRKIIKINPIKYILPVYQKRATKRQQEVREVLVFKHFSVEQEKQMVKYLFESKNESINYPRCVTDSIWLIAAVRFFTGMAIREVCALKWSDICIIDDLDIWQIRVTKFLNDKGHITTHAERENWKRFRLVPVSKTLQSLLKKRYEYLIGKGINAEVINDLPIVMDKEVYKKLDERKLYCKPTKGADYCRRLLKQANLPELWVVLPDEERELKTDLYKYNGDIFLSNIKMHLNHDCGFTLGELNYMVGIEPPDTFSKHYCDFSSDLLQYEMVKKMFRWDASCYKLLSTEKMSQDADAYDLIVNTDKDMDLNLNVDAEHGYSINVDYYGERK